MDLSGIPLFDHHCHSLARTAPLDGPGFRRYFTESGDVDQLPHVSSSLFYRRSLRDVAALLDCHATEEAILAARGRVPAEEHARRLFEAARIGLALVDTGFRTAETYTLREQRRFLPCPVHEALRLESRMEECLLRTASFAEMEDAFRAGLEDARAKGFIAFKSIAAYRGGLEVRPRSREEAAAAYPRVRTEAGHAGRVRLTNRALLEYLLRAALEAAARQEVPVQFHTGFGDADLDLRAANPLHLRPLLEEPSLRRVPFVLLHVYPFVREAGFLASLYSRVYVDLSLALPFTAHAGEAVILEALELAPASKVLLATDASGIPELFYSATLSIRRSLAGALDRLRSGGWLTGEEAGQTAHQLLWENAAALYRMG